MFQTIIGLLCLAVLALGIIGQLAFQLAWGRRDVFWRHHDHLIPPEPRFWRRPR